jgi:hypothetical protein
VRAERGVTEEALGKEDTAEVEDVEEVCSFVDEGLEVGLVVPVEE